MKPILHKIIATILTIVLCSILPTEQLCAAGSFHMPLSTEALSESEYETETESETETVKHTETESEILPSTETEHSSETEQSLETEPVTETFPDLDYILDRPMTDEERHAQEAYVPDLQDLPSSGLPALSDYSMGARGRSGHFFPSSYDSRSFGYITPVKNQLNFDTCWAFTALACGEASLLRKGLFSSDLSERHFAYFFYNTVTDPLGLTSGDFTSSLNGNYLYSGGNNIFSIFALAKWTGAATEALAPYPTSNFSPAPSNLNNRLAYQNTANLTNAYVVPSSSILTLKSMVQNYGSFGLNLYMNTDAYYNPDTAAYCYKTSGRIANQNHTVVVVGWDDDYSKENFSAKAKPTSDGAWLAKNSWGTNWGDDGYFWISYEDATITSNSSDACAYVFDFEETGIYDHNYQYDGSFGSSYDTYGGATSIANIFTAKGNTTGADELLKAVSFAHYTPGTAYEIQIYKNLKDPSNPQSGEKMLSSPQIGVSNYAGYQTVPLDTHIKLPANTTFSVVIRLIPPSDEKLLLFMDRTYTNGNWIAFTSASAPGQSYLREDTDSKWYDCNFFYGALGKPTPSVARIKAFTRNLNTYTLQKISLASTTTTPVLGKTAVITASLSPSKSEAEKLTWTTSNNAVAKITTSGTTKTTITATGYGTAKITVKSKSGITASITITVKAPVLSTVSSTGYNQISLSWPAVPKATGYQIYRSTNSKIGFKKVTTISKGSTTAFKESGLTTGTLYYYKLRSYRKSGSTYEYSSFSTALSASPVPGKATISSSKVLSKRRVLLNLKTVSGASGYEVYYSNYKDKNFKKLKTLSAKTKSYTATMTKSGTWYFKVRAYRTVNKKNFHGSYSTVISKKV